jgi:hypothetical protein
MRDNEVHLTVIQLIRMTVEVWFSRALNNDQTTMLRSAYSFLRSFCSHNTTNQSILYEYIPSFFKHVGYQVQVAELLAEIFRDNRRLVSIMSEKTAREMVNLPCIYREERYLKLLEVLVFNQQYPLKRNQDLIMRLMLEKGEKLLLLFVGEKNIAERKELLQQMQTDEEAKKLITFHTYLIHLMSQIAKGLNSATEIMCASVVSLSDCVVNIRDTSLPSTLRVAYFNFALEVSLCSFVFVVFILRGAGNQQAFCL